MEIEEIFDTVFLYYMDIKQKHLKIVISIIIIIIIIVNIDLPRGFGHLLGKHFFSPMSAAGTM